jgi:sugar phosphate isomerase/epimerase
MGICFDIGHANVVGDIDNFLENIKRFLNVHIHDNNGHRDEHLVLGEGSIDIPNFVDLLVKQYSGSVIIECNNIEEGIMSKNYIEKILKTY